MPDMLIETPEPTSPKEKLHSETLSPKLSVVALRERKKDQTRTALARAAFALFQAKGYEGTTVAEIARAANVSRRTFFRYYPTKDALLFVDMTDQLERFREVLTDRSVSEPAFASVRRGLLAVARDFMRQRDQIVARARIIEASPVLSKQERQQDLAWEEAITAALLASVEQPSDFVRARARMLAGAIFGAVRATMAEWHSQGGGRDLVAMANEGLALFDSAVTVELEATPAVASN